MTERGGAGRGQGRKPTLRLWDRFMVCARFEKEWAELAMRCALERHKAALPYDEIDESRTTLQAVPLNKRKQLDDGTKEHLDWLGETLDGHRLIAPRTPQGCREDMMKRIAEEESEKHGVVITGRMLKRWMIEYKRFCREV